MGMGMGMGYDDPNAEYRFEQRSISTAGAGAVSGKFRVFQKQRLCAIHCWVETAGTSVGAGNSVIVKQGTVALATFTLGTLTAGSEIDVVGVAATLNPGDLISLTNGTDATGVASFVYEMQQTPDAVRSAY